MSIRRKVGDVVMVRRGAGFSDLGAAVRAEIMGDGSDPWCWRKCGDDDCAEWATLWTMPTPEHPRRPLYHVGECEMADAPGEESAS